MTNNNELHLEKITWDNMDAIINLHVTKEQRNFVASNKDSLADACVRMLHEEKKVFPFGIYLGKKPVGFIMITYDIGEDDGEEPRADWFLRNSYFIWRFMIDGRQAMKDNFWPLMDLLNCMYEYEPSLIILKSGSLRESLL